MQLEPLQTLPLGGIIKGMKKLDKSSFFKRLSGLIEKDLSGFFAVTDDMLSFYPFFKTKELKQEFICRWFRSYDRNGKVPRPKIVKKITINLVGRGVYDGVRNGTLRFSEI